MMNEQLMPNWLRRRAALAPDSLALLAGTTRWSFAELDQQATLLAQALLAQGIKAGDRVALLARNSPLFVALVHAMPRIGATLVPLNLRLAAAELAWQLADVGAALLLYDEHQTHQTDALRHALPGVPMLSTLALSAAPAPTAPLNLTIDQNTVHTIIYTSGTTGRPKGAMLTYGNHWWSAIGSALNLGTHTNDCWLAVLPLFHVGGLAILLRSVIYGVPVVLHESFDPLAVNRAIDEQGVTIVSVVSTMLQRLLEARGAQPYPASLRCFLLGGGPAPRPLLDACAERGLPVVQTYGMTETASQVATLAPADALRKLGSAGKALLPMELQIAGDDGLAQPGEVGEILVRGPTVMKGYVNQPAATALALHDGWLHTGDLGYLDAEGYLTVVDRRADLIISGGENIYPAEVEAVLLAHPAIAEAGVVGMADARWGQVPLAWVVLRPGCTADAAAIIEFCTARLARYKVPRELRFVAALPRNAAGKLQRAALRQLLERDEELQDRATSS